MIGRRPREVAIPRLLHVGHRCLDDLAPLLADHELDLGRVLVGSGPGPSRQFARTVVTGLRRRGVDVVHRPDLTGRLDQAATVAASLIEDGVTTALAVGGGRVIDTVKLAAARTCVDFVSVPTAISNDGISSPVASLIGRDGVRASHAASMPSGIVVDVDAIATAPPAAIRAGAGDLLSNLTACLDWRLADAAGQDHHDAYSSLIAESAARPVLQLQELASAAAQRVLAEGLLLSGLAMAAAGTSRPCSGSEHLISHALDARLGPAAALHGEQVALGCLVAAAAHGSPLLATFRDAFARLGLPLCPEDLGLPRTELVAAVRDAPSLRPDRHTVLTDRVDGLPAAARLVDEACGGRLRIAS
jgi:glycerol-1-phosphate dehydrogenase [NAD(P)+]